MVWIGDLLQAAYPWTKSFHIVAVISWMAAMFYLPRLYVYHAERARNGDILDETFRVMEQRLASVILRPAMIATWLFGLLLVATPGVVDWSQAWPWMKAAGVIAMTATHGWLVARGREFADGRNRLAGRTYRIANEVPTVLLLVIVVAVIVRPF